MNTGDSWSPNFGLYLKDTIPNQCLFTSFNVFTCRPVVFFRFVSNTFSTWFAFFRCLKYHFFRRNGNTCETIWDILQLFICFCFSHVFPFVSHVFPTDMAMAISYNLYLFYRMIHSINGGLLVLLTSYNWYNSGHNCTCFSWTWPRHRRHLPHGGSAACAVRIAHGLAGHDLLGRAGPAGRDATGRCRNSPGE